VSAVRRVPILRRSSSRCHLRACLRLLAPQQPLPTANKAQPYESEARGASAAVAGMTARTTAMVRQIVPNSRRSSSRCGLNRSACRWARAARPVPNSRRSSSRCGSRKRWRCSRRGNCPELSAFEQPLWGAASGRGHRRQRVPNSRRSSSRCGRDLHGEPTFKRLVPNSRRSSSRCGGEEFALVLRGIDIVPNSRRSSSRCGLRPLRLRCTFMISSRTLGVRAAVVGDPREEPGFQGAAPRIASASGFVPWDALAGHQQALGCPVRR
jgi:hypothetical protein